MSPVGRTAGQVNLLDTGNNYYHVVVKITNNLFKILMLYRIDYSASIHVRAVAKLLGTSHVALLPYLKRLEKLKILNSEKAGRNKQYTLNKDNLLTKYFLTATEELVTIDYLETNFLIKKLAEHLNDIDTSNSLILFGSHAKDYATKESDIDLFSIGKLTEDQLKHIKRFEGTFGRKINIKTATTDNFNRGLRTGDILIKEVVKNHIILRNAEPFVTLLWRQYVER
jgi:predicted nucleotidyltransferase